MGWMDMDEFDPDEFVFQSLYFVFLRLSFFCQLIYLLGADLHGMDVDKYDRNDSTSHRLSKLSVMHDDLISCVGCTLYNCMGLEKNDDTVDDEKHSKNCERCPVSLLIVK